MDSCLRLMLRTSRITTTLVYRLAGPEHTRPVDTSTRDLGAVTLANPAHHASTAEIARRGQVSMVSYPPCRFGDT